MSDIKELIANELRPIGDAIREKTERATYMTTKAMAEEIRNFQTDEDAKKLIKVTFNKDFSINENIIIPAYVEKITTPNLLQSVKGVDLIISEGITEIAEKFCYTGIFKGKIYFPKTLEKIGASVLMGGNGLLAYCDVYYNNTFDGFLEVNKNCGNSYFIKTLFHGWYNFAKYKLYFKDESDSWYDVYEKNPIIKLNDNLLTISGMNAFPFELDFTEVSSIPSNCFQEYCTQFSMNLELVKNVTLTSNITSLGSACFSKSIIKDLTINTDAIKTDMSSSDGVFYMSSIKGKLKFGDAVTGIGAYHFRKTVISDTQITIPENVKKIGSNTFYLKTPSSSEKYTIRFTSPTPCTITSSSFDKAILNKIYVPKGFASIYKSATNWSTFADYIFEPNTVTVSIPDTLLNNESYTYSIDGGDFQQFTTGSLTLENIATFKIKNSGDVTINVGTTDGGTEIGSVGTGAELLYATESDTTIYLTVA